MWDVFVAVGFFILVFLFWRDNFRDGKAPPGPLKLPIIGNIHNIAMTGESLPYKAFDKLAEKYGPILSLKMGTIELILLTSLEDMSALLSGEECVNRLPGPLEADRNFHQNLGIIMGNGDKWRSVRRFTIQNLRQFGFGKKANMESVICEEVTGLIERTKCQLLDTDGQLTFDMFFNPSVLNVIWSMVAGKRFQHDDPRLLHLLEMGNRAAKSGTFGGDLSLAFPIIRTLFPSLTNKQLFKDIFNEFHEFIKEMQDEHCSRPDFQENPESFVDIFLAKVEQERNLPDNDRFFTDEQFIVTIMDIFQTGSETLNGSLSFAMLFMLLYPEVQKKVQEEISKVAPSGTPILLSHKSQMSFTQAVIQEIMRFGNIVPIIPPRQTTKDFHYKGYHFKKSSAIFPNLYSVVNSKELWSDPEAFRPERFLTEKLELKNIQNQAPFGFGKRICMGEPVATPAIFLYFTMMLKYFQISRIPGKPLPPLEPFPSFTLTPQPFKALLAIRE